MKIEIITIGNEILNGQILNSNSNWMAQELTDIGFEIIAITSVGDNAKMISQAFDVSFNRADILLVTGGLGPTKDDLTKKTLCNYFKTKLIFNDDVFKNISNIFSKRNIPLNNLTKNQALVPENCTVIQNTEGTAPILWFEHNSRILISMPGVPFEMKNVMITEIIPRLKKHYYTGNYFSRHFLVGGISESALALRLENFERLLPKEFSLAYLPSFGTIRLRLSVYGENYSDDIEIQAKKLRKNIEEYLIAQNNASLEEILGDRLSQMGLTISTAESCTGGYIAHCITRVSGASKYFIGSIVSYSNSVKNNILCVNNEVINEFGVVSEEVVEQMAAQLCFLLKTDCGIAVSGIAGPTGGSEEKPIGTVWICTRFKEKSISKKYNFGNNREENIIRTANMGMLQLLKMLS